MKPYFSIILIIILFVSCEKETFKQNDLLLIFKGSEYEYENGTDGITFTYDELNRLVQKYDYNDCYYIKDDFTYNNIDQIIMITNTHGNCNAGDLVTTNSYFSYDQSGKLIQKVNEYRDHRGTTFWDFDEIINYTYDTNGLLLEERNNKQHLDPENGNDEEITVTYHYSADLQLNEVIYVNETLFNGNLVHVRKIGYEYNQNGNLVKKQEYYDNTLYAVEEYQYDDMINPLFRIPALNRQDNIIEHQSINNLIYYSYDDNGILQIQENEYSYNAEEYPETVSINYTYKDMGDPSNNDYGTLKETYIYQTIDKK